MAIKVGSQLRSAATTLQVVVVRGSEEAGLLEAAGSEMNGETAVNSAPNASAGEVIMVGKRYMDETSGIEVLVISTGPGPIRFNGRELLLKDSKPLPASD